MTAINWPAFTCLAFLDGEGLDAPGNLAAHHHFIGVHRADQLQIGRWDAR